LQLLWWQLNLGVTSYCSDGKATELLPGPEDQVFAVRIKKKNPTPLGSGSLSLSTRKHRIVYISTLFYPSINLHHLPGKQQKNLQHTNIVAVVHDSERMNPQRRLTGMPFALSRKCLIDDDCSNRFLEKINMSWNEKDGDRRKEPRYDVRTEVKVMTPDATYIAAARNISGGGMEIQLPKCINPHTELTVSMKLQDEFIFRGTVVWTLGNCFNNQWIHRVGIETRHIVSKDGTAKTPEDKREVVKKILPYICIVSPHETMLNQAAA